jgi:hypothetical protein
MMTLKEVPRSGSPTLRKPAKASRGPILAAAVLLVAAGCGRGADDRVREIYALSRIPTPEHVERIVTLAHDPDRDVRASALVALDGVDAGRARSLAREALADRDGLVRAAAVRILAGSADPLVLASLADRAAADPIWQVRAAALEAIASHDDPAVRAAFAHALLDPVRQVRRAALTAGAGTPGLLPTDRLAELLAADPDWQNRVDAARGLGASASPAAFDPLDAAGTDGNEFVRAAVARALRDLAADGVARPTPPPVPSPPPQPVAPLASQEDDTPLAAPAGPPSPAPSPTPSPSASPTPVPTPTPTPTPRDAPG